MYFVGNNCKNALISWLEGHGNLTMFSSRANLAQHALDDCPQLAARLKELSNDGVNYTVEEFEAEFAAGLDEFDKLYEAAKNKRPAWVNLPQDRVMFEHGLKYEFAQRVYYSLKKDLETKNPVATRVGALHVIFDDDRQEIALRPYLYQHSGNLISPMKENSFNFNHDVASWRADVKIAFTFKSPEYCRRVALNFVEEFLKSIQDIGDAEAFGALLGRIPAPGTFLRAYKNPPEGYFAHAHEMISEAGRSYFLGITKVVCLYIYVMEYLACDVLGSYRKKLADVPAQDIAEKTRLFTKVDYPDFVGLPTSYTFSQGPWWNVLETVGRDLCKRAGELITYIVDDGFPSVGEPRVPGSHYYADTLGFLLKELESYRQGLLLGLKYDDCDGYFCGYKILWTHQKPEDRAFTTAVVLGEKVRRPNSSDDLAKLFGTSEDGPEVVMYAEK